MAVKKQRAGEVRPGGRTRTTQNTVATSVLNLIKEGNFHFSYSELAALSGVHQTTLYRRWPPRTDLIREAIKIHNQGFTIKNSNNWEENAEAIVRGLADFLSQPVEIAINRALLANPQSAETLVTVEYWEPIQAILYDLVIEAQQSGELPDDIDPSALITTLASPLIIDTALTTTAKNREKLIINLIKIARLYGKNC